MFSVAVAEFRKMKDQVENQILYGWAKFRL